MCLYPTLIKNRKYKPNKKNGWNAPPVPDERVRWVPIGCQECMECRKQKAREWQVRMLEDLKEHRNGKFITLTFSNKSIKNIVHEICTKLEGINVPEGYDMDNEIAIYAVRHFLENWRKKYKRSLRHWFVTELGHGETEHVHIHGIVWTDEPIEAVADKWIYGWTWTGKTVKGKVTNYVNERTVNYIIKYVSKMDLQHKGYKSRILTSPGIGRCYTNNVDSKGNTYKGKETREYYRTRTGHKIAMPTYWRNKIYSEKEREELWLQRLDKLERWVCGEKVSIKENEKAYEKLLIWHQRINKKLGYGDGERTWEQEEYERQRRNLKIKQRIENAKT